MKLEEMFDIYNGLPSSQVKVREESNSQDDIPYIRPSSSWSNLVAGFIARSEVPETKVFPPDTLFVSTDGEGSHTYAYVSPFSFVPNSNVAVLIPKTKMRLKEKIFYAACITKNRYRFSYGRKPKGQRLASIALPETIPKWVDNKQIRNFNIQLQGDSDKKVHSSKAVPLTTIFNISYGNKFDFNKMVECSIGDDCGVNFVSRKSTNLGIVAKVRPFSSVKPYKQNLITVTLGGTYLLSSFVQPKPFYTAQNIAVLEPKLPMSLAAKLFYCLCISNNRFRYSAFGREANRTLKQIMVPSIIPEWVEPSIATIAARLPFPIAKTE